jgi:sporulation protein YlmC with PRC-barrel domain
MAPKSRPAKPRPLHLLREVLDHEVVDAEGDSCGMVDDIELEWTKAGPRVAALQLGPGAWSRRLPRPLGALARWVFGGAVVRIPWAEVVEISEVIRLRSRASAWGAGALDRRLGRWMPKG